MTAVPVAYNAIAVGGGGPASGAKANVYTANTTTRSGEVYTNPGLTTPATNPVVADADGRFLFYLDNAYAYDVVITTSDGAVTLLAATLLVGGTFLSVTYAQFDQFTVFEKTDTGTGSQTVFSLTDAVASNPYQIDITIDALLQNKGSYTVTTDGTDTTVTFSEAPPNGSTIYFTARVFQALSPYDAVDVSSGVVTPTGGTTARTLAARFADVVNVKDYGATGDGSTNDTTAIAAAITAAGTGGAVYFPEGVYIFSDHNADNVGLTQLSGQRWYGDGRGVTTLRLSAATTSIIVAIQTEDDAEDYSIEDLEIDGNRGNITPSSDLYNTFYLVWGADGGKRATYRNLLLSNSWGRVLQTSKEAASGYATDILVENVHVINAGTKAISATKSKRVTISNCFAEVDPYANADHGGSDDATSGSCFECNDAHDVTIKGNHGIQIGATIEAPGIRLVNASSSIKVFGNTIEDASYGSFTQNCDDVDVFGNTFRDIRGNAVFIGDSDDDEPTATCKRVRVHHNTIIDPDDAYVLIRANKDGEDAYVEAYIYENDFVQVSGSPTYGIFNGGVESPATGGECLVYEWGNRYTGTIPNQRAGTAAHEIQPEPNRGWQMLAQSSVAVSHTGDTNETTLATITVPGNRMGKNGRVRITAHWSYPTSGNNKITRVRWAGSQATAATNTTTVQQRQQIEIGNRNSLSSQIVSIPGLNSGFGLTSSAVLPYTIDTSADRNITLTVQLANTGETIILESYTVELFYQI